MTDELARRVRRELLDPPSGVYLNTAAEGLTLAVARDGYERYLAAKSQGSTARDLLYEIEDEARTEFGRLLGVPAADIAFVASTSRAIDAIVKSIHWSPGDSLVLPSEEFPTALFAADLLARSGVVVRAVPSSPNGTLDHHDIAAAIDNTTKLVILSAVSFKTGQHQQSNQIISRAHDLGALVLLDCVQAAGQVEVSVGDADFACAASFKWLHGVHGAAGLYINPRALPSLTPPYAAYRSVTELFPDPPVPGRLYDDARRYQEGMPDFGALAVLVCVLRASALWRPETADHNYRLTERLRIGLLDLGAAVLAPNAPRGSIIAFETPRYTHVAAALAAEGTTVWARDGRVRLSPHVHTTSEDVEAVLEQLARIGVQ